MNKIYYRYCSLLIAVLVFLSCNEKQNTGICNASINMDNSIRGELFVDSKGKILFEPLFPESGYQKRIQVQPCSDQINRHILNFYDTYVHLKSPGDRFIVELDGAFKGTDSVSTTPPAFFCNGILILEETEAIGWVDYRLGELSPAFVYAGIDSLVRKWNLVYHRIEAGCDIGYIQEEAKAAHDRQNAKYFRFLEERHGKDWKVRFDKELRLLDSLNQNLNVYD